MATTELPLSARFALWFSALARGRVSLDDTRDAIVGPDAAHDVTGMPGSPDGQSLIVALGTLRARGATGAGLALPAPGDPVGLAGPADFNMSAVEAGEAVVLDDAELGLVPHRAGAGVVWVCRPAVSRRQVPDPSEADAGLRHALLRASQQLAALDVARWRPEIADELMSLRQPVDLDVPPDMPARAEGLASLSCRCLGIVDLALEDEGGSVSVAESNARRHALTPLAHAARRGLVAACSPSSWG